MDAFKALSFVTVVHLAIVATGAEGSPGTNKAIEPDNLTCYACNSQLDGEECRFPHNMTKPMLRTCPASHRFCSVTRVDYSLDPGVSRPFSIERSCSEHCTTECVAVGERLRLYMCRSCCRGSLCNVGDSAPYSLGPNFFILMFLTVTLHL